MTCPKKTQKDLDFSRNGFLLIFNFNSHEGGRFSGRISQFQTQLHGKKPRKNAGNASTSLQVQQLNQKIADMLAEMQAGPRQTFRPPILKPEMRLGEPRVSSMGCLDGKIIWKWMFQPCLTPERTSLHVLYCFVRYSASIL